MAKRHECGLRVAGSQLHRAARLRRHRAQHLGVEFRRNLGELAARAAGGVHVAYRQHDLDVRGQQTGSAQPVAGLSVGATNRRCGRVGIPLGEPQEREPGLWLHAELAPRSKCLSRRPELAAKAVNLAAQIARPSRRRTVHRLLEAPASAPRLLERVEPVAVQAHQLGAVDEAPAGERPEIGLSFAPARQRRRPLLRAAQLVDVLAREDDAAVDDAAGDRRNLAHRDGNHRLIQQSKAFAQLAVPHEEFPLHMCGERREICVSEAMADLHCSCSRGDRAFEVAAGLVLERHRDQHVPLLGALAPFAFDQPLCAAEPPGGRPDLTAEHEVRADPEGTTRRTQRVTAAGMPLVGPLEDLHPFVLVAEHVRGRRQKLEILGRERRRLSGAHQ